MIQSHLSAALRAPLLAAAVIAAAVIAFPPVLGSAHAAATQEDHTQFSVTAGSLVFAPAPGLPTLSPVTLNGLPQATHTTMTGFGVADATGSGAGWNVAVEGLSGAGKSPVFAQYCAEAKCGTTPEGYVAGGSTLAPDSLILNTLGASFTAQSGTTGLAPALVCVAGCAVDSPTPVKVASASLLTGMGTWLAGEFSTSSLTLATPSTLKLLPSGELYRVNLLWTLSTGP